MFIYFKTKTTTTKKKHEKKIARNKTFEINILGQVGGRCWQGTQIVGTMKVITGGEWCTFLHYLFSVSTLCIVKRVRGWRGVRGF